MMDTYSISDVEIFSVGTWNNTTITQKHLHDMVAAFEETKKGWPAPLKLGHADRQKVLESSGLPAAGWIKRLYVKGTKLVADFEYIPKKIHDLIRARAYRKVSCEVYWDVKVGEKVYSALLGAVALLGDEKPGVQDLDDILAHYKKVGNGTLSIYSETADLQFIEGDKPERKDPPMAKTETEIQLETQLKAQKEQFDALQSQFSKFQTDSAAKDKTIADLTAQVEAGAKKEAELQAANQKAATAAFCDKLVSEKICSPAMKPMVEQLLAPNASKFSIADKEVTKEELVKELLSLAKKSYSVNLEEGSESGEKAAKDKQDKEDKLSAAAEERAKKDGTSYSVALKAVMAEQGEGETNEQE